MTVVWAMYSRKFETPGLAECACRAEIMNDKAMKHHINSFLHSDSEKELLLLAQVGISN